MMETSCEEGEGRYAAKETNFVRLIKSPNIYQSHLPPNISSLLSSLSLLQKVLRFSL